MPLFLLTIPVEQPSAPNGVRSLLIEAKSEGEAQVIANQRWDGDFDWNNADINSVVLEDTGDFEGWTFTVRVSQADVAVPDTDPELFESQPDLVASYVGVASDGLDEVGEGLKAALNALEGDIAGADWDLATRTLTVADTSDAQGDRTVAVAIRPPGCVSGEITQEGGQFVEHITHQGAAEDALTVLFAGVAAEPTYDTYTFVVRVEGQAAVSVDAAPGDDITDVAGDLVTGLNALDDIDEAAYDAGTRTLTVASATDALGDKRVDVDVYIDGTYLNSMQSVVESITSEGSAGDALTVVFKAPVNEALKPKIHAEL